MCQPILIAHAHRLVCTYVICVCHMTVFATTRFKMVGAGINVFSPILFATKYVCRYMHPGATKMCQCSLCSSDSACSQTSLKTYVLHMTYDWVSHDTWSAQGKMCFHRKLFAANAVRLVSFLFTLYSNRMYNTQCCVCTCECVVNVKTG